MFFTNTLGPTVITGTDDRDTVLDFFPDATGRFIDGIGSYPNFGAGDDDTISLGDGEDRTILSPGNDRIDGGPGWDTIAAKFSPSFETPSEFEPLTSLTIEGFVVDLALGTYRAVYTGTYAELVDTGGFSPERVERDAESIWTGTLTGIEAIDGSVGPDTLLGSDETPTTSSGSETAERFNPSLGANVVDGRGGEDELYVDIFPGAFESVERDAVEIDTAAGVLIGFDLETTTFRNIERYSLSAGSDTLRGSPADERVFDIIGPGGQASLVGGAGEDLLILSSFVGLGLFADEREGVIAAIVPPGSDAAAGRNVYRGFERLNMTAYDDGYRGDAAANWVAGSAGEDTLRGARGADTLLGGTGADTLLGQAGRDSLVGGAEADEIDGGRGADTITPGAGDDLIAGGGGRNTIAFTREADGLAGVVVDVAAGTARDPFGGTDSFAEITEFVGTVEGDSMSGDGDSQIFKGGDGADTLEGLGGRDHLLGEEGRDLLRGGAAGDSLEGGAGSDRLEGQGGSDVLEGGALHDRLEGGKGRDTLEGGAGRDTLEGGAGNDTLRGGEGRDLLEGNRGEDELRGGPGDDVLRGGALRDDLDGGPGADELFGGAGPDRLQASEGADLYDGGAGSRDALSLLGASRGSVVDLGAGSATGGGFGNNRVRDVEIVFAVDFNDTLTGSGTGEMLSGSGGRDVLNGAGGDDTLHGGAGRDLIQGARGDDTIEGDTDNTVSGPQRGNDVLRGGQGADVIRGNRGNDRLEGQAGRDTLDGGPGNDVMAGGGGVDRFVFSEGDDRILGFDVGNRFTGTNDRIDVSGGDSIARFANLEEVRTAVADPAAPNLVIRVDGHSLTVQGVSFIEMTSFNFDFA